MRHRIKRLTRSGVTGQHIVVDCESEDIETDSKSRTQRLRLWCGSCFRWEKSRQTRRTERTGTDAKSFWDWLASKVRTGQGTTVWMHGAINDLTWLDLWGELLSRRQYHTLLVAGNGPTIIRTKLGRNTVTYLDSCNFFPVPLREIGKTVGLEKYELPQSFDGQDTWLDYCFRDVHILERALVDLFSKVDSYGWGRLGVTASSQAMILYRTRFMEHDIFCHGDEDITQDEANSYYGGRCEVYFAGDVQPWRSDSETRRATKGVARPVLYDETVHILDVNSLYPSVMRGNLYPTKYRFSELDVSPDRVRAYLDRYLAVATCQLQTRKEVYPCRDNGRTIYATGRYWTTLAGPEIRHALETGALLKCGVMHLYDGAEIFTAFVDDLYAKRRNYTLQSNTVWASVCKSMMNSLFGKFGQRRQRWEDTDKIDRRGKHYGHWFEIDSDGEVSQMRTVAGRVQRWTVSGYAENTIVAIPAYVTAYARVAMRRLFALCPAQTLLYTDTDSLHVLRRGYDAVLSSGMCDENELGKLKLKGKYTSARYYSSKVYVIGDDLVMAGTPKRGAKTSSGGITWEEWDTFDRMIDRGPDGTIRSQSRTVNIVGEYAGGLVGSDGWVVPIQIMTATEKQAVEQARKRVEEGEYPVG